MKIQTYDISALKGKVRTLLVNDGTNSIAQMQLMIKTNVSFIVKHQLLGMLLVSAAENPTQTPNFWIGLIM
jgi:hypothetical protein